MTDYDDYEEEFKPTPIGNHTKWSRKEEIHRPGRSQKAELKYRGSSSIPPRKDHKGKGKTLRDKRK